MANVLLNLNHSSSRLLQQINENQWGEALILEALTRSRSEGFLWCLALDGVLQDLRQLGVPSDTAVLLSEVQSLASLEEKECQTLNTLLSHVDGIYELKVITDQFIALMRQDIDERGKLLTCVLLSCCFQSCSVCCNLALCRLIATCTGSFVHDCKTIIQSICIHLPRALRNSVANQPLCLL